MKPYLRSFAFAVALLAPLSGVGKGPAVASVDDLAARVTEANITRITAGLLARSQFATRIPDDQRGAALFDRFLDALDSSHSLFLESDVADFSRARATLVREAQRVGDTRLAHTVFRRYLERLEQRVAFVTHTLETGTFEFTAKESFSLDRRHASWPLDLAAARELWLARLRFEYLQEKLDDKPHEEIVEMLGKRAQRSLQNMRQMSREAVLEVYLSALARVYDPHSDYLGREQMQEFDIQMNLALVGIGARLRSDEGRCRIVELLPGGQAEHSGQLGAGDVIVAVAQGDSEPVDVVDMPLRRIVQLIRGPKGTEVRLTVIPAGEGTERKTVSIIRDEVKLEGRRAKARILDLPVTDGQTRRLGIVELPSFYAETGSRGQGAGGEPASATSDVAALLAKLEAEEVEGIILDLRRNGGGSLKEAISLTGLFIREGPVVQTRGFEGNVNVESDTDPDLAYRGPLIVLTSSLSASASEIVAAALQDYGRAVVIGDASTYGKGTVQSVVRLAPMMERSGLSFSYDPGALKLTIRKFYRPSGGSTQLKGVIPDIVLPSPTDRRDVGESVLDDALPWDTVPPRDYERVAMVAPHLETLREKSARRVAAGRDFTFLREEMARLARRLESRTVSLNEAERRRERAEAATRREELAEVLRLAQGAVPTVYELTVMDAGRAGLPDPVVPDEAQADSNPLPEGAPVGEGVGDIVRSAGRGGDIILREAQRVLLDYLSLLSHNTILHAQRAERSGAPARVAR